MILITLDSFARHGVKKAMGIFVTELVLLSPLDGLLDSLQDKQFVFF
jgi:hypothetical protein